MDKRRPAYDLKAIKAAFARPQTLAYTRTALEDALALGFGKADIVAVIQRIEPQHFYKSMTTFADHRVWQDVYHVPVDDMVLYVKFQGDRITAFRLMSFKER